MLTPQEHAYAKLLRLLAPETLTTEEVAYLAWYRVKVMA
jgi:hypothetical protein